MEIVAGAVVSAGNGGDAVWGAAGYGGEGILLDCFPSRFECSGCIVNGSIYGGNGGDSRCGAHTPGGGNWYPYSASSEGSMGVGGDALEVSYVANISGTGIAAAGDSGSEYNDINNSNEDAAGVDNGEAIDVNDSWQKENFAGTETDGSHGHILNTVSDGTTAVINADFTGTTPSTGKKLTCTVTLPGGGTYDGDVYYDWRFRDGTRRHYTSEQLGEVEAAIYGTDSIAGGNSGSVYTFENTLLAPVKDKVRAYVEIGEGENATRYYSGYSNNVHVTTTAIAAPRSFDFALYSNYLGSRCTWSSVAGIDGFQLRIKKNGGAYSYYNITEKTYYYKKLNSPGAKYWASVRSYKTINGVKYYSSYTTSKYMYTLRKTTVRLSKSKRTVKVRWSNISAETGYQIYRKAKGGSWKKVKTRSYKYSSWSDKKKTKNKYYYYKVRAYKYVNGRYIYGPFSSYKKIRV